MLAKMKRTRLCTSMEAIRHQSDIRFRKMATMFAEIQLILLSDEFIKESVSVKLEMAKRFLIDSDVPKFLKDNFGIKSKINISTDNVPAAAVLTSIVSNRTALLDAWRQSVMQANDARKLMSDYKKELKKTIGLVDRKNAKVSGIFSELENTFYFDTWWFLPENSTPEEAAAVFFHEIGHVFTFYELTVSETQKNELMTGFRQIADPKFKQELQMLVVPEQYQNNPEMLELLDKSDDALEVVMRDGLDQVIRSEIGNQPYSERGWEQLADDFATKLGAGIHLHSALDKLNRNYKDKQLVSTPVFLLTEVCKIVATSSMVAASVAALAVGAVEIAAITATVLLLRFIVGDHKSSETSYDPSDKRLARIRQETIGRIRDPKISKDEKKALLEQLKVMEAINVKYRDRSTFFDILTSFGGIRGAGLRNSHKEQALLEKLAQNELHVLTAKLDNYGV